MGTVITIDVYPVPVADDSWTADLGRRLDEARMELQRADEVFSLWRQDSPVSRLRRGEITAAQAPPEVVAEVMSACEVARQLSGGWFDPWAMPGGFDPTGYVKGWAAQRAAAALDGLAMHGALVNAAGDIASVGGQPSGDAFRIGIADPGEPRRLAAIAELTGCIATSGTYERGSHLIDPHSGSPAAPVASASVIGPDLGLADALATAVAVAGIEGLDLVEPLAGYEALVIGWDGRQHWTSQFPFAPATGATAERLSHWLLQRSDHVVDDLPGELVGQRQMTMQQPVVGGTEHQVEHHFVIGLGRNLPTRDGPVKHDLVLVPQGLDYVLAPAHGEAVIPLGLRDQAGQDRAGAGPGH
jgi:FAD:protein FMN transferase